MSVKNKIKIIVNGKQMQVIPKFSLKSLIVKLKMPLNKIAIELNRKIIDSIMDINPMSKVITMGDFNDNPDDPSIKIALKTESEIDEVTSSVLYNPMEVLYTKKYYWTNN